MTREELQGIAEQYVKAWERRDPTAIAQFHASDCVAESPIYATLRGRKAIEEASRAFFTSFPDAALTIDALLVDGSRIGIFTTINATHVNEFFGMPGTNKRIEFRNARLMETDETGLITRERRIYDFTGLLVQIGILRAKPAKP